VIVTARKLANASPGKPRQADLRRAISTEASSKKDRRAFAVLLLLKKRR
jgi:hypothetical protein